MIDYAPSAIIEYTDISPCGAGEGFGGGGGGSINETYPQQIPFTDVHFEYDDTSNPSYYAIECPYPDLPSKDLPRSPSVGFGHFFGGSTYVYYWVLAVTDSDGEYLVNEFSYYSLYRITFTGGAASGVYERVGNYILEEPPQMPSLEDDTGVFWLYNFGAKVFNAGYELDNILGFGIGNYNFFYILLSGGFLVYMGWCVIKFIL